METDSLLQAAAHTSFAERNHLSNVDVFAKGLIGVVVFMLLLILCMKLVSFISQKMDKKSGGAKCLLAGLLILGCCSCGNRSRSLPDEAYLDFLQQIIASAYQENPDPTPFNEAFDIADFSERITAIGDIPASSQTSLRAFLEDYFKPGEEMLRQVMEGADYQLVKFYWKNDTAHALFRIYDGNVRMEDWTLVTKRKQIFVQDILTVISGLRWSEEWNLNACMYLSERNERLRLYERLIEVNQLVGASEFEKADSLFNWIANATGEMRYAQVLRLNLISQSQSFDSLVVCCARFIKQFPDNQDIAHFYLLQNAIRNGSMPQVDSLCQQLEKDWGPDPIYFLYKAWGYKAAQQLPESLRMLDSLVAYIPLVYDFYNYQLDLYDAMNDPEGFVRQLQKTDSLFFASEEDIPFYETTYPNMTKSNAYQQWKQHHLKKLAEEQLP